MRPPLDRVFLIHQLGWQELKETLARAITNRSSSPQRSHAFTITSGLRHNLHLSSLLIGRYSSLGDLASAISVFYSLDPIPKKTLIWNSIIRSCINNDRPDLALGIFDEMVAVLSDSGPDVISFNLAIKASIVGGHSNYGFRLAELVQRRGIESHPLVSTPLIVMYSQFGDIASARKFFDETPERDVVSWNAMISRYSLEGDLPNSVNLFKAMKIDCNVVPSQSTLAIIVSLCGRIKSIEHGQVFHGQGITFGFHSDIFFSNALMEMYINCNCLNFASLLFEKMTQRDAISWSILIGGYLHQNRPHDSIKLFHWMISSTKIFPSRPILLNFFHACADIGDWRQGKQIEEEFVGRLVPIDAHLATTLVFMYAKCGRMDMAFEYFDKNTMVMKDNVAWNALIKGCVEAGNFHEALEFLVEMQRRLITRDRITLLTMISISSLVPSLSMGMTIHAHCLKRGFFKEGSISNSLIEMYAKCGNIEGSCKIFVDIKEKNVVAWSSMMKAYCQNGCIENVLSLFSLMKDSGTRPNHFTFMSVLSACSRGGYLDKACKFFKSMKEDYGLDPCLEHYACMVDLLGRAGYISEAFSLIERGPAKASNSCLLWRNLLNACSLSGNCMIGEEAGKHLFQLEPRNASNYLILTNIYLSVGRRDKANGLLRLMRNLGLEKNPGFSELMEG